MLSACGGGADAEPGLVAPETPLAPAVGILEIITTRQGLGVDPDGYSLTLNGYVVGRMEALDTFDLLRLSEGTHWVGLADVAAGCSVGGGNPRGLRVNREQTTRAIFVVKCPPQTAA